MSLNLPPRLICLGLLACAFLASEGYTQNRNQMNQGGAGFGQSGFGQTGFGGASQAGRGQSRGAGAGFGQNAFGGAAGGSAFGGGGFGGTGPQATGTNQRGVGPQEGFLGGNGAQTQNFFRNMNGGQRRTAMFDFMIENLNDMRETRGRNNRNNTPPVRVRLRPAFETPLSTMKQVSDDLQSRLSDSVSELGVADSRVSMDDRTLTLEGSVQSEHQRALVEKMMSLEPGISEIDNRLTVEPPLPPQ
jgi:hypothetical protein